jgi:hypothetical protein
MAQNYNRMRAECRVQAGGAEVREGGYRESWELDRTKFGFVPLRMLHLEMSLHHDFDQRY